jgi:aerobic carbon-monoxide dehydrogenase medium subunit
MDFYRPASLVEAVSLLAQHEGARCLAGGATLVAMLNANLIEPSALISLADLRELSGISALPDGSIKIGAMTRHAETASSTLLRGGQSVLSAAAQKIANAPVRNMGTIGGSLAFADPAADYLPALAVLDASIELASPAGNRAITIAEHVTDWYTTALQPDEIITAVIVPPAPDQAVGVFEKLERTAGDFAIASVALVIAAEKAKCKTARIAVGACAPGPVRRREAEAFIEGSNFEETAMQECGRVLAQACDPVDDVRATAEYRRLVVPRLVAKTIARGRAMLGE